jgi:trans-aconitate methyltransferase
LQQRFPQTTIVGLDINYGKLAYAKNATNAEKTQFIQTV